MFDTNLSMSEARCFLLAVGGALLFSLACLAAAIGPAKAHCICTTSSVSLDRPTLL
jgi:energy-converting hydrogenase Eha subunit E